MSRRTAPGIVALGAALALLLAGCGSNHAESLGPAPTQTGSGADGTTTLPASRSLEIWFALGDRLVQERRTHAPTPRVATAALEALLAGPTRAERAAGIGTAVPAGTRLLGISIAHGVATVDLTSEYQSGGGSHSMQVRLGQVVYTLTQFPTVRAVRFQLDGAPVNVFSSEGIVLDHPVGRNDYANLAPTAPLVAGTWRRLAVAPIAPDFGSATTVWTGTRMLVFGRDQRTALDAQGNPYSVGSVNVAASYDPATDTWRRLAPPAGSGSAAGRDIAVWTGKEMLVAGADVAFDPRTGAWRRLPPSPAAGVGTAAWTGRELITWGGGCCGDAFSDGAAYNPATNRWRGLAPSPLAGSTHPVGAWTGRELILLVGGVGPDGKPWPARLARAAAYDPATNAWRRIAPLPARRDGAVAAWDGKELLVVGGTGVPRGGRPAAPAKVGWAYDPASNRWRSLPPMEPARTGALAAWTGKRLLVWGGTTRPGSDTVERFGLAFDPKANRWAPLPGGPLGGHLEPTAVWTGRGLVVWGGVRTKTWGKYLASGAVFTPSARR